MTWLFCLLRASSLYRSFKVLYRHIMQYVLLRCVLFPCHLRNSPLLQRLRVIMLNFLPNVLRFPSVIHVFHPPDSIHFYIWVYVRSESNFFSREMINWSSGISTLPPHQLIRSPFHLSDFLSYISISRLSVL